MSRRSPAGAAGGVTVRSVTIGLFVVICACGTGPMMQELAPELDARLVRARDLAARAAEWDHDRALEAIAVDPELGTVFRLDDSLASASFEARGVPPYGDGVAEVVLDTEAGVRDGDGIVAVAVDQPLGTIGALEVEIASPRTARVDIELRGERAGEAVTIDLRTVGDGELRTFRVDLEETFASWASERLAGVRFRASMLRDSEVLELRRIALLSPTAAYAHSGFGLTHRRQGVETRWSIFQWASSTLRLPLTVDNTADAALEVGLATSAVGAPVQAEITVRAAGTAQHLASETVQAGTEWRDLRIPLGDIPAGDYTVELRVTAPRPNVVFWSNPSLVVPPVRRFNIIMVLEDALRADHLSCYGYHRPTTPVKDAFSRRGVRFARCYAQATKTRFSCPSFMTSLLPTATGVEGIWHPHPSLHPNYLTLAEALRRRGFVTASIHQNANAGSPAGLAQGFSYLFENVPGRAQEIYTGVPLDWIERHRDRNFMLYLHLADPHEPYDPPRGFRRWFEELEAGPPGGEGERLDRRDPRWMQEARRALYDGEIAANDHWFEVFIGRLHSLGLSEDTLIVFMSDHGEHLGEHGLWSHNPPSFVQVLHTPLIMVSPRRLPEGVVVSEVVQNLDIMPTILELAGIDAGGLLMQGDSLVPLLAGGSTSAWSRNLGYAEEALLKGSREAPRPYGSVFFDRWHLLDSLYAPSRLFDLASDPAEENRLRMRRRLVREVPAFLREMQLAELDIWRGVTRGEDTAVGLDPSTINNLKALGYLE